MDASGMYAPLGSASPSGLTDKFGNAFTVDYGSNIVLRRETPIVNGKPGFYTSGGSVDKVTMPCGIVTGSTSWAVIYVVSTGQFSTVGANSSIVGIDQGVIDGGGLQYPQATLGADTASDEMDYKLAGYDGAGNPTTGLSGVLTSAAETTNKCQFVIFQNNGVDLSCQCYDIPTNTQTQDTTFAPAPSAEAIIDPVAAAPVIFFGNHNTASGDGSNCAEFAVHEVLTFDAALSDDHRDAIKLYMLDKWS